MTSAFSALIWWLVPLAAVVGALGYVLWVTKFQEKFQNETTRSVSQFQLFQSSFRPHDEDDSDSKNESGHHE
jgi:type II secretory pathway component PulF